MWPIHVVGCDSAQEGRGTDTGCSVDQPWEHERSERLRPKAPGRCSVYTEGPEQASPGTESRVAAVGAGRGAGDCLGCTIPPGGGAVWGPDDGGGSQHTIVNAPKAAL